MSGTNKIYDKKVRLCFVYLAIINFFFAVIAMLYGTPFLACLGWLTISGLYSVALGYRIFKKGEHYSSIINQEEYGRDNE